MNSRSRTWRPTTDEEKRAYLAELESSGLSVRAFALRTGVSPFTVYGWRKRLRRSEALDQRPLLLEVELADDSRSAPGTVVAELRVGDLSLTVPGGFHAGELARLIDVVRSRC